MKQPANLLTHHVSLKFVDDGFSSAMNDTLLDIVNITYAHTGYVSFHTATHPRQDLSGLLTGIFYTSDEPIQSERINSHLIRRSPQRIKTAKTSIARFYVDLSRENGMIVRTKLFTYFRQKIPGY